MPITLRNINSNVDIGGISRALSNASTGLNNSFSGLQNSLQGIENKRNADATKALKDQFVGLSASELADFNVADADANSRLSASQIQAILNPATAAARNQETAAFNFGETQRQQAEAPIIAQARNFGSDIEGMRAFLAENPVRDSATLLRESQNLLDSNNRRARDQVIQGREDADFALQQDSIADEKALTDFVRSQGVQNQTAISTIREKNKEFAESHEGVSFNADGSMNISDSVSDFDKLLINRDYGEFSKDLPKVLDEKGLIKSVQNFAQQRGATLGQESNALRSVKENEQIRTQLSADAQAKLSAGDALLNEQFNVAKQQEDSALQHIIDTSPVNPPLTAKQEKVKSSAVFTDLRNDIASAKKAGDDLGDNFDDDGDELKEVTKKMQNVHNAKYAPPGGGERIPYPNWVRQQAYQQVGLAGVFQPGILDDSTNISDYTDALNQIMEDHLRSEGNQKAIAEARSNHISELAKLRDIQRQQLSNNLKNAKNKSGIFDTSNVDPAEVISNLGNLTINR